MSHHPLWPCRARLFVIAVAVLVFGWSGPAVSGTVDPYGDCCVAGVVMTGFDTWAVTCGSCSANPGRYVVTQPDPARLVYTGPGGVSAASPHDAAAAVCQCPSQDARLAREKKMRTFDGN